MAIKVTAQTKSAGRGQTIGGLANAWANPNNIVSSNDTDATIAAATSGASDELWADSFNFALTNPISVCGVRVNIELEWTFGGELGFRLIKGGIEVGSVCARTLSIGFGDVIHSAGASGQLWGTTFTEAEIEASGFGVSFNVHSSFAGAMSVDHVEMTVHYSVEAGLGVDSSEYGCEVGSVDTEKNLRVVGVEFDHEIRSTQALLFVPENEFGYESGSPALTQTAQTVVVQSFERGHEWASTLAYDSLIGTSRAEFDHEWGSSRTFTVQNLTVTTAEWGWEVSDPSFRYFIGGFTPEDRTIPGGERAGSRYMISNSGDRRVVVHLDRNQAHT